MESEKDINELDIKNLVEESIEAAFKNFNIINQGKYEDKGTPEINKYYIALANKEQWAIEKREKLLKEFLRDDEIDRY